MDGINPPPAGVDYTLLGWFQSVFRFIQRRTKTVTVTTAYTVAADVSAVFADATSSAFAVTLPSVSDWTGREIGVYKTDASANAVTVSGAVVAISLSDRYYSAVLKSDGTNWFVKTRFPAVAG